MTFTKSAWAIDGATSTSALARTEAYAATAGSEGVIAPTDLKVTQLGVAGDGVQIAAGAGLILNRYQGATINQTYAVVNPSVHTLGAGSIPGANGTYIVAVTIGDPAFSQSGHPWMTTVPPGTEATFEYVRPFVMTESAFNSRNFPAIALAKIVKTATNITNAMITDMRVLARPRSKTEFISTVGTQTGSAADLTGAGTFQVWPVGAGSSTVPIPTWAKTAKIMANLNSIKILKAGSGVLRVAIPGAGGTPWTAYDQPAPNGVDRIGYSIGGVIDVSALAGSGTITVRPEGNASGGSPGNNVLRGDTTTSFQCLIIFDEAAI